MCRPPYASLPAAYVLILSGTAQHNGDPIVNLNVADSRTIFYTQSVFRCQPSVHVVCEVRGLSALCLRCVRGGDTSAFTLHTHSPRPLLPIHFYPTMCPKPL